MKNRVLLIDDERLARHEMRQLLSEHAQVEVVGEAADVDAALGLARTLQPDLVFLDVQLAGESGFDFVARLPEPLPRIVFVTAYDRFAVRAFECNALDYLLKPVHPQRLAGTLRRVEPRLVRADNEDDVVYLKSASEAKFTPWSQVRLIESDGNYTNLRLADGTCTTVLRTLKQWADLAPESHFLQVHRTTLVRRADIRELRSSTREIVLVDGTIVPIGRTHWPQVKLALGFA